MRRLSALFAVLLLLALAACRPGRPLPTPPPWTPVPLSPQAITAENVSGLKPVDCAPGGYYDVAFSPDGRWLAVTYGADVDLYEVTPSGPRLSRRIPCPFADCVNVFAKHLVFSPDSRLLAGSLSGSQPILWRVRDGEFLREAVDANTGPVLALAFSADGTTVASVGWNAMLLISRVSDGQPLRTFEPLGVGRIGLEQNPPVHAAFSRDGATLAFASRKEIRLWRTEDGQLLRRFGAVPGHVLAVALSWDGSLLAAGGTGGIAIWRTADGARLAGIRSGPGTPLAFSPDGSLLADGGVSVWRAPDFERVAMLGSPHKDEIRGLAFSADGSLLASVSGDGTRCIWTVQP